MHLPDNDDSKYIPSEPNAQVKTKHYLLQKSCLRSWLNNTFLNAAFSAEEQKQILITTVTTDKNPSYSTNPGNNTSDKLFLLSITEADKYFTSDSARQCKPTAYAEAQGCYVNLSDGTCWW